MVGAGRISRQQHPDLTRLYRFYIQNGEPPRSSTVHPSTLEQPGPSTSIVPNADSTQPAVPPYSVPAQHSPAPPPQESPVSPPQGQTFAQKLYADSLSKTSRSTPASGSNSGTTSADSAHISYSGARLQPQRNHSIDLGVPAPQPTIQSASAGVAYPDTLRSYLASSRGQSAAKLNGNAVYAGGPEPSQATLISAYSQPLPAPYQRPSYPLRSPHPTGRAAPVPAPAPAAPAFTVVTAQPAKASRASMLYANAMASRGNAEAGPSRLSKVPSATILHALPDSEPASAAGTPPVSEMRSTTVSPPAQNRQRALTEPVPAPTNYGAAPGPSFPPAGQVPQYNLPALQQKPPAPQGQFTRPPRESASLAANRTSMFVSATSAGASPGSAPSPPAPVREPSYDMSLLQTPAGPSQSSHALTNTQTPPPFAKEPTYDMSVLQPPVGGSQPFSSGSRITYDSSMLQMQPEAGPSRLPNQKSPSLSPPPLGTNFQASFTSTGQMSAPPLVQTTSGYPFPPISPPNLGNTTPNLSPSSPSNPTTPSYAPMPPTPTLPYNSAPQPPPKDASGPGALTKSRWPSKTTLTGLGAGAAVGLAGAAALNGVINGDANGSGVDMSGMLNLLPNLNSVNISGGGGLLDGMFSDSGGDGSGAGISQGFGGDSSGQQNPYDQQQQQQTSVSVGGGGPNYAHIAQQAWSQFKKYQNNHQQLSPQQQQVTPSTASPAQYPAPANADPGYQAAHNAYHSGGQPGQSPVYGQQSQPGPSNYSQTQAQGQHQGYGANQTSQQQPQNQGLKINKTHVKQFAKGAVLAGGVLAKLNGFNFGNGSANTNT